MATKQTDVSKLLPFTSRTEGDDGDIAYLPRTRREQRMCQLLNAVRDKPDWARKWRTDDIRTKWAAELCTLAQQDNWTVGVIPARKPEDETWWYEGHMDEVPLGPMSNADFQALLDELDFQAEHVVTAAGPDNVFARDDALDESVRMTLAQFVADQLENVPDSRKDWHPRSNNQVLDLVHPSLFPLVYGRTRILKNAMTYLDDWSRFLGQGEPLQKPDGIISAASTLQYWGHRFTSNRFQWLPSVFNVAADGTVTIGSYINNLRPDTYGALYPLLARVFEAALPLLESVVSRILAPALLRIEPGSNRGFITARQGRLVAFPNLYQHQVAPFELADPTRPGHRKIIAFFLIDPISPLGQEVVTTAQVPPQQAEWIADAWAQDPTFPLTEQLPREVLDMVVDRLEVPMTRKEAMALRLELMDERTDFVEDNDILVFGGAQFSLCEH
ncbi:hypothetical protein AMAG_15229 [Allomyces macrogynus ATCC 38327]|uniref:Uncharacterized protein n=1 Tax=Allomyces macrogynus (strain ATCC 38327) TaxID=578462 RepID=A0A0L0T8B4_ALLM3|nr:hypothetical protein AMAG_15229 [Allomyces macrogynus ATCC 38327]|eukprot:KNE70967.1 hypothetical protein AMAG_15229 [Allomyces macrogynus ATCC 38327]